MEITARDEANAGEPDPSHPAEAVVLPGGSCAVGPAALNQSGRVGAIVMNANPFTLGHRYLVEQARTACGVLHLFMVSEDVSLVPFSVRKKLIIEGTKDIPGIVYHEAGSYIISSATFPAYFQKGDNAVIRSQAGIDAQIFTQIAAALGITDRFVGDEPTSVVTGIYNEILSTARPAWRVTSSRGRKRTERPFQPPRYGAASMMDGSRRSAASCRKRPTATSHRRKQHP